MMSSMVEHAATTPTNEAPRESSVRSLPARLSTLLRRHIKLGFFGMGVVAAGALAFWRLNANSQWQVVTIDEAMAGDVKGVGDLDGDGFVDLVIGGKAGIEDMVWYRYPDWKKYELAKAKNEFTTDMQLADVDSDGDLDVVVADGDAPNNVLWLENPRPKGKPTQKNWARHVIGSQGGWVHDVAVADLDGDKRIDVVTRKETTKLWYENADGSWFSRDLSKLVGGGEGLGAGDVDGDGDTDLVANCAWFENPTDSRRGTWRKHGICKSWNNALTATVADLDADGTAEIIMTSQHDPQKLSVFSRPNSRTDAWQESIVGSDVGGHKINVCDFDLDGRLDIQTALEKQHVSVFLAKGGGKFARSKLPYTGHNLRVGDIGNDGDCDIFGAEYTGGPPVRVWQNKISQKPPAKGTQAPGRWRLQRVTDRHERTFGLAFADVDKDKKLDIVSGNFWYQNQGAGTSSWPQHRLPEGMQACLAADVDGDANTDIFAQKDEGDIGVYWLERSQKDASGWEAKRIGTVPRASHALGAQGYFAADLEPGGKKEIALSSGGGTYYFVIPGNPGRTPWTRRLVSDKTSDEGIAAVDLNRDGRLDVISTSGETKRVQINLNPDHPGNPWKTSVIGELPNAGYLDRVAGADLNGDGRADVIVTEENGQASGAKTFWFEQPKVGLGGSWPRHLIVDQASTHSLDVADLDGDGDLDIVLGEHRGALKQSLWVNDGKGHFQQRILVAGVESHLGTRLVDLDGDGDLDVVSIAWDKPENIDVLWNNQKP